MNKKVILNCTPPYSVDSPSPALSVLKGYLQKFNYQVDIIYWNLLLYDLENEFLWDKKKVKYGDPDTMDIYSAYMAVKNNDQEIYKNVKASLQALTPIMLNDGDFYDQHISEYVSKLDKRIDDILDSVDFDEVLYFGFSMKLDQWTLGAVISEKIKERDPAKPIVVGGINTPEVAVSFLKNFSCFDVATYGEGEIPLKLISDCISNNGDWSSMNIPRTLVRRMDVIEKCAFDGSNSYTDLSDRSNIPCYEDYFQTRKNIQIERTPLIILEGSRGCHWNRCHFCYLNRGYQYRKKSIDTIIYEMRKSIAKYGIFHFEFADNDVIGNDFQRFSILMEKCSEIKKEYPEFSIVALEIITKGVDHHVVQQMKNAGVMAIQIGYESASDPLLKKIEKKNSFASNLNVINHCNNNNIAVNGMNVIHNLLEENLDDIYISLENLRFFRFILEDAKPYIHTNSILQINSSSKYFKQIAQHKEEYEYRIPLYQVSYGKKMDTDSKWDLFEWFRAQTAQQWVLFNEIQYHFLHNKYSYSVEYEDGQTVYNESFNDNLSESFDLDEILTAICKSCYSKPISLAQLQEAPVFSEEKVTEELLREKVDFLFQKGLVYRSENFNEIVSIINI